MQFEDAASAAIAAARCANEAIAAANAAAYHANKDLNRTSSQPPSFGNNALSTSSVKVGYETLSGQTINPPPSMNHQYNTSGRTFEPRSFNDSHYPHNAETMQRRHSHNAPSDRSGIKFDESDSDEDYEEIEADARPPGTGFLPPQRSPPRVPSSQDVKQDSFSHSVHPKLPDYDSLAARFEALKHHRKSLP